jgi:ABC-2 type transport system permease protein
MAVYKRAYKGYGGGITQAWSRFLILPRYSYEQIFKSRFLTIFLMICAFVPLVFGLYIYFANNLTFLDKLNVKAGDFLKVNANFFLVFMTWQSSLSFILTALVGPNLVAPDLANNGLALYLGRPFSRVEYVVGKMSVLMILLSLITWLPGLLLFGMQWSLAGWDWAKGNFWIAWSLFIGFVLWITILSLLALALSAWVKWRIAAGAALLGVFFAGAGFGSMINAVLRTQMGSLLNLGQLMAIVWSNLFGIEPPDGPSVSDAWSALLAVCVICVFLLNRKIRAYEVVR